MIMIDAIYSMIVLSIICMSVALLTIAKKLWGASIGWWKCLGVAAMLITAALVLLDIVVSIISAV